MIKHIVFWKLKPEFSTEERVYHAQEIKLKLLSLKNEIPEIEHIEVGFDFNQTSQASDVCLYSVFPSKHALEVYQQHPSHLAVIPFIKSCVSERRVVDYETNEL